MRVLLGVLAPKSLAVIVLMLGFLHAEAQTHKCGTERLRNIRSAQEPAYMQRLAEAEASFQHMLGQSSHKKADDLISIPVVVHVLYNNSTENISDKQIQSQIDVLNTDFQHKNADSLKPSHAFYQYTSNTRIEFCLANTDPDGKATTGITRTKTDSTKFFGVGNEKFKSSGGVDNWDPNKYLNVWVCRFDDDAELLGYAAFPTDLEYYPDEDGVVIDFRAFGTIGTAGTDGFEDNNLGRTATHEVGHWLYLEHVWGDDDCGDDGVSDTPPQKADNSGCPTFPHNANNSCGSDKNGEMFMNYMDYPDDYCLVMFTKGQNERMRGAIKSWRSGLLSSPACSQGSYLPETVGQNLSFSVFPNPGNGNVSIQLPGVNKGQVTMRLLNAVGETISTWNLEGSSKDLTQQVNFSSLPSGVYFLNVSSENQHFSEKIIINQ